MYTTASSTVGLCRHRQSSKVSKSAPEHVSSCIGYFRKEKRTSLQLFLANSRFSHVTQHLGRGRQQSGKLFVVAEDRPTEQIQTVDEETRRAQLLQMTVDKGLKPILRVYGLQVGGKKSVLIDRIVKHEMGYPDLKGGEGSDGEAVMKDAVKAKTVLKGYQLWKKKKDKASEADKWAQFRGVKFDVAGMVGAVSEMVESDPEEDSMQWKEGLYPMSAETLVRMQLEALSRAVEELYIHAKESAYSRLPRNSRQVAVEIDVEQGRMLVLVQKVQWARRAEDGGREMEVVEEWDDTMAALEALAAPNLPPAKGQQGKPRGRRSPLQTIKEVFVTKLVKLREEYDQFQEEVIVQKHFGGRDGQLVKGTVVRSWRNGNFDNEDVLLQVMPGFVRAYMPAVLRTPDEKLTPGQEINLCIHQVLEGAAAEGKCSLVVSRNDEKLPTLLLTELVPEIKIGEIEIVKVVRIPGFGTKMSVQAKHPDINAVGTCLGRKKWRIARLSEDLGGETVSIVEHSEDAATFIAQSLFPAYITAENVNLNTEKSSAEVSIPTSTPWSKHYQGHDLKYETAKAIGRKGSNVQLASKLTGYFISVKEPTTEEVEQASKKTEDIEVSASDSLTSDSASSDENGSSDDSNSEISTDKDSEDLDAKDESPLSSADLSL